VKLTYKDDLDVYISFQLLLYIHRTNYSI